MAATLTPAATTGKNILFTASEAVFLQGDVGRQIIFGASRAIIVSFSTSAGAPAPATTVRADILDDFPNTEPIPAGQWFLRLSPQAKLTFDKKAPIGTKVTITADKNAFRSADLGKYIIALGGVVEIQGVNSTTVVVGEILGELQDEEDPIEALAGAWTLEVSSWSPENGFPRTGEFVQGRLVQASTLAQPTTFWMSAPDDFDNYAIGIRADDALEYTIATRKINRIEWITEVAGRAGQLQTDMYIGGTNVELLASSGKSGEPFGGDVLPLVNRLSVEGSAPVQAVTLNNKIIFLDRSRRKVLTLSYNIDEDSIGPVDLTAIADHLAPDGIKLGPIAFQQKPHPRFYFVGTNGTLITLTYYPNEKIVGWSRIVTEGTFEAVACVTAPAIGSDLVYVIVRREINDAGGPHIYRYVEVFDDNFDGLTRSWKSLQTDSAIVYIGAPTTTVTGLTHLEDKTVDVIADGAFRGTKVVVGGQITLDDAYSQIEVGLHYDSRLKEMPAAIPNVSIEGMPKQWIKLFVRLFQSMGGTLNGENLIYPPGILDTQQLFTGDIEVTPQSISGNDTEAPVEIVQNQPYPMTVLCTFGTLEVADRD